MYGCTALLVTPSCSALRTQPLPSGSVTCTAALAVGAAVTPHFAPEQRPWPGAGWALPALGCNAQLKAAPRLWVGAVSGTDCGF